MQRTLALPLVTALLGLALIGSAAARADWLVTNDGERIETRGPWKTKTKILIFEDAKGNLSSLRLEDVDLEASEAATKAAKETPAPPPTPPPVEPNRAKRRITNADIPLSIRPTSSGAEGLAEDLREALERRDTSAAMHLVRWEGAPPRARELLQELFDHAIKRPVNDVRIVAVGENDETEYQIEGVTYRPNVEVTGKILIDLGAEEGANENDTTQISFLIGRALGNYYIASAVAVDDSDE